MDYTVYKQTYSEGRAYRYRMLDEEEHVCCVAERREILSPSQARLASFLDREREPIGHLHTSEGSLVAPWLRDLRYEFFLAEAEDANPHALIRKRWNLVDVVLLRLPRYELEVDSRRYVAQGSRYGDRFYGVFLPPVDRQEIEPDELLEEGEGEGEEDAAAVRIGEIRRPVAGPDYAIEVDDALLTESSFLLAALVVLIDIEVFS